MQQAHCWRIVWDESLSVGIPEVDEDHRRFIGLINDLNQAIVARAEKAEVGRRLFALIADAKAHFDHEERLFREHDYPEAERHAEIHSNLLAQLGPAMVIFESSPWSRVWVEKGLLIKDLLVEHLLEEDMRYREFLSEQMNLPDAVRQPAHSD